MKRLALACVLAPCLLALPASCAGVPTTEGAARGDATTEVRSGLAEELRRYQSDRQAIQTFYGMPRAPQTLERLEEFEAAWQSKLDALDYEGLASAGRVDYHLLQTELVFEQAKRELLRQQIAQAAPFLPFEAAIARLETARWKGTPIDPQDSARVLDEIAKQAQAVLGKLKPESEEESRPDPSQAIRLARWTRSARRDLATWHAHYSKFLPGFEWWCKSSYEEARTALEKLANHFKQEIARQEGEDGDPLVGQPIGAEALAIELAHEWLAYTPEELIAIGEKEFAWCEEQLALAADELGFGDQVFEAIEAVKAKHAAPGEQDALVIAQGLEAIAWLKENDLVTIPPLCEETWRVRMIDEEVQKTLPFAAYGRQTMQVAFPTSEMDFEGKQMSMRGNNRHFTRSVTPHELIPGHHLQGFMASRFATWRRPFRTPFLVEGWALYWEMVEYDMDWPKGPEDRIGMLFWRMHRAARIIVSLRFHLGEMQPEEMIDFLVERVGHEENNARSEVRRYIGAGYSALYQCGYMIGGLQLRALSREAVGPGKRSARAFHDAILRENAIPIELIRASLLEIRLERDARASWKPAL